MSDDDTIKQIEKLAQKKEQAQILLTRYTTQLETLTQERDNLVEKLEKDHGTTVKESHVALDELKAKRDKLLLDATTALRMIDL